MPLPHQKSTILLNNRAKQPLRWLKKKKKIYLLNHFIDRIYFLRHHPIWLGKGLSSESKQFTCYAVSDNFLAKYKINQISRKAKFLHTTYLAGKFFLKITEYQNRKNVQFLLKIKTNFKKYFGYNQIFIHLNFWRKSNSIKIMKLTFYENEIVLYCVISDCFCISSLFH